jgi:hypothetical protein
MLLLCFVTVATVETQADLILTHNTKSFEGVEHGQVSLCDL